MDPITTAIVAGLPALASDMVTSSLKDAYEGLRTVIRRKWGEAAPVVRAIDALEADPGSKAQAAVLEEKVAAAKATEDPDVMRALAELVSLLKEKGIGGEAVASIRINISGGTVQGVVGGQHVAVGTMSFGVPPKDEG